MCILWEYTVSMEELFRISLWLYVVCIQFTQKAPGKSLHALCLMENVSHTNNETVSFEGVLFKRIFLFGCMNSRTRQTPKHLLIELIIGSQLAHVVRRLHALLFNTHTKAHIPMYVFAECVCVCCFLKDENVATSLHSNACAVLLQTLCLSLLLKDVHTTIEARSVSVTLWTHSSHCSPHIKSQCVPLMRISLDTHPWIYVFICFHPPQHRSTLHVRIPLIICNAYNTPTFDSFISTKLICMALNVCVCARSFTFLPVARALVHHVEPI